MLKILILVASVHAINLSAASPLDARPGSSVSGISFVRELSGLVGVLKDQNARLKSQLNQRPVVTGLSVITTQHASIASGDLSYATELSLARSLSIQDMREHLAQKDLEIQALTKKIKIIDSHKQRVAKRLLDFGIRAEITTDGSVSLERMSRAERSHITASVLRKRYVSILEQLPKK